MNKDTEQKIDEQMEKVAEAKSRAAVQEQFANDYIDIKGVRFYKATVAHAWFFARTQLIKMPSLLDHGVVIAYALAHDSEGVRNKLMAEATNGTILNNAYAFMIDHELETEDCTLAADKLSAGILTPVKKGEEKKTAADLNTSGGPGSSTNSPSHTGGRKE